MERLVCMSLPEVILRLLLLSSLLCLSPAGGSEEGASRPYVSIIMGGRNDDWGGNFTARLHSSLSAIGVLSSIHNLHVEVIVVDYNPPADAPPISALPIPEMVPPSEVRIVTVPAAKHASLSSSPQWQGYGAQLYEYVAKNVGLRAATGDFALFTNPDIILSPPLIGLLASQTLDARAFYTLPRTDLPSLPPQGLAAGAQVDAWCRASGAREGKELAPGDFLLASRLLWNAIGGFPETGTNAGIDTLVLSAMRVSGVREVRLGGDVRAYHQPHDASAGRGRAWREQREMRGGRNSHAESALLGRLMRVIGQRVVWAVRGADGWGLGGKEMRGERREHWCAGKLARTSAVECAEAKSMLSPTASGRPVCASSSPGRCEDACSRAGLCVALQLLGGATETARVHSMELAPLTLAASCPLRATAALASTVGAMEQLSFFPDDSLRAYRLAARLDPRWAPERAKAEMFSRAFRGAFEAISLADVRESYGRMEQALLDACPAGDVALPLSSLSTSDQLWL